MRKLENEVVLGEIKQGIVKNIARMNDVTAIRSLTKKEVVEAFSELSFNSCFTHAAEADIFIKYADIGEEAMEVIIDRFPILLTHEIIKPKITPRIKRFLLEDFCKNSWKYYDHQMKCGYIWCTMEMTEDMWKEAIAALREPGAPDFRDTLRSYLEEKKISSEMVADYVIEGSHYNTGFPLSGKLTKKYFDLWLKKNNIHRFSEVLELSKDRSLALEAYPELYQYIKSPTAADANVIVNVNPKNLSMVKRQSEKLCLMALKKDKSVFKYVRKPTKKILTFMGMDPTLAELHMEYPEKNYLVTCKKDVADEDDIIFIKVIPGKDMEDFMSSKLNSYGFGNIYIDDCIIHADDIVKAKPISDEEISVLEKFGILELDSGHWDFEGFED